MNSLSFTFSHTIAGSAPACREKAAQSAGTSVSKVVIVMSDLSYMASAGLRVLIFAKQKMGSPVKIVLVGLQESVKETLEMTGFQHSVTIVDAF
jgi:anti-sigma B factor antagonist